MLNQIRAALDEAAYALDRLRNDAQEQMNIEQAGISLATCLREGGKVISCGNGGSMCDAMHLAEELSGRFRLDRPALAAMAISDPSHLSCVANDFGYDQVFSRYVEAVGKPGDILFAISTSGSSQSVVRAATVARSKGIRVIALTGASASALGHQADICICTGGGRYADRTQELHIKVIHILIELVEHKLGFAKDSNAA